MTNRALEQLDRKFRVLYSRTGRPSVAPEQLLRALLLQILYSIRSERMLMEQLDYNLLFRWFVGLEMDDRVWDVTVFTKNRNRLLEGEIAEGFFQAVLSQAREAGLLSDEHFTVDGTLIEAWASHDGYAVSQRKCVEQVFGWGKVVGPTRKAKHRGRRRVVWMFTFTQAAYNLVRMRPLLCPA